MDWKKVTLPEFVSGTVNEHGTGSYSEICIASSNGIRSKDLIPVSKAINIPIVSGWLYCCVLFDSDKNYLGESTGFKAWSADYKNIALPSNTVYLGLCIKKKDETNIGPQGISTALPGYIWTAGDAEITEDDKGIYTKGRNLVLNSKNTTLTATGTVDNANKQFTFCSNFPSIVRGRVLRLSMDIEAENYVPNTDFEGNKRYLISVYVRKLGDRSTLSYMDLPFVEENKSGRFYSLPIGLRDLPFDDVGGGIYIQGMKSGSVTLSKPMITIGDEIYPWSSAPEDEDNPSEAI